MARPEVMQQDDEGGVDSGSTGSDGYDRWNCREQDMLIGVGLQCISCGLQDYYSQHGQSDVVPSEKWLALLAVNARSFRPIKSYGLPGRPASSNGYGTNEMDNMKRLVIAQIQSYGFCTKYISKDTMKVTRGSRYRDLSSSDWAFVKQYINFSGSSKSLDNVAKFFGFRGSFLGNSPMENMRSLFDDSNLDNENSNAPIIEKRRLFKDKLKSTLTEYDISGEKIDNKIDLFAAGDADNGIHQCMEEVQKRLNSSDYSTPNVDMCENMAKSCNLATDFCHNDLHSQPKLQSKSSGRKNLPPLDGNGNGAIK